MGRCFVPIAEREIRREQVCAARKRSRSRRNDAGVSKSIQRVVMERCDMKNRIRVYVVPDLFCLSRHSFPAVSYDGRLSLVQHNILHQTGDIAVELIYSGTIYFRLQVHFKQLTVFVFQVFAFHFLTTRAIR